ncbi:hypothetical protein DNAM_400 [Pseudomonas phage BroderSalsa]|nr:hypothetical protein DNAM_400 [Pseudomonas phage BroderSalsa]
MLGMVLYIFIAIIVTAVCQRIVYAKIPEDGKRPYPQCDAPPRIAFSVGTGMAWPLAIFGVLPVYTCYKLTVKTIDKFLKA